MLIAAAKQRTVDTGLEIGTKIFELTGARASRSKYGLDRFWRNLRTTRCTTRCRPSGEEWVCMPLVGEYPTPTRYT